ncbi:hypothetical protein [Campylobacter sp. 19-13652]|nr:hypothetical protein [Campylobacter sp. 19-13652]
MEAIRAVFYGLIVNGIYDVLHDDLSDLRAWFLVVASAYIINKIRG